MTTLAPPGHAQRVAPLVTLLLVFLCGGVTGAVLMSMRGHTGLHGAATPGRGLSMSVQEWRQQLDLSDDQTRQLTSILDDFSRYYDNVLADGNSRILLILNDTQKRKFEKMMREHKAH